MAFRGKTDAEIIRAVNELDGNWSNTFTPWGDQVICALTINGVTRTSIGAGMEHAFNKACTLFGITLAVRTDRPREREKYTDDN